MTDEQWQEIKTNYDAGFFLRGFPMDQLIAEVERLRAEVERLSSPKPGFLAWVMQVEDALPVGMAMGVNVEELRRWFEAGMTAPAAALRLAQDVPDEVAQRGQRVRDDITR